MPDKDKKNADPFDDENGDLFADDSDTEWNDEMVGRLPGDEPYGGNDEEDLFSDPDEGLPPEKAASRRAMLGVPNDFDEDDDNSPARALQDAIIDEVNDILEDEWRWNEAAERAYEALVIDPTYPRAANALMRCYLTKRTLRDMQHALFKRFHPEDEEPNQTQRMLATSYHVLSHAGLGLERHDKIPPELADVAGFIEPGRDALNDAYFTGEDGAYRAARAAFTTALERCQDRLALMWFLACEYADKGYFADSAALLGALLASGSARQDVQRLYAEMTWWRDQGRWLPWIH